jgi:hypothetical protein
MAGLVPAIHDFLVLEFRCCRPTNAENNPWMAGTRPAMTI